MSRHDPTTSIRDMLGYADKAMRFCEHRSQQEFGEDEILQFAVVRALELVGEAAGRVPLEVRNQYPSIPWSDIVGTRNRLIHGYDRVDLEIVWNTIQNDLPVLVAILSDSLHDPPVA